MRVQDAFTAKELKALTNVPSNEIVSCQIHKLVQVKYLYHFFSSLFLLFMDLKVGCFV